MDFLIKGVPKRVAMKRLLPIALAVAAPAHAQGFGVTPEQYTALQSYFACILQQVSELDDGTVEVESLTPKVAPACRYLLTTAARVFAPKDQAERDALYNKWLALEPMQVSKTVWAVRLERRAEREAATSVTASAAAEPVPAPMKLAVTESLAPRPAASKPKPAAATASAAKPMSEWRRAYIAKHGHEPPIAVK
jgi:hypothetical protein